ncbi:MAG: S8 family peptidase [Candidatus Helarchaeota archaeon]
MSFPNRINVIPISNNGNTPETDLYIRFDEKIGPQLQEMIQALPEDTSVSIIITLDYQPSRFIGDMLKQGHPKQSKQVYSQIRQLIEEKVRPGQLKLMKELKKLGVEGIRQIFVSNMLTGSVNLRNINAIANLPGIARVEYNFPIEARLDTSVPSITQHLPYSPWNSSYNGSNIVVAICDTGINEDHQALQGCVIDRYNVQGGYIYDDHKHGSHVAGIVASRNALYTGVAPNVSLLNVKVLDSSGNGIAADLMIGAEWAVTNAKEKADIITFSGGAVPDQTSLINNGQNALTIFIDALTHVYDVLWVSAAGNEGSYKINIPGDSFNCLCIGNIDNGVDIIRSTDVIASSSSTGPTYDGRIKPDLVAPGQNIRSIRHDNNVSFRELSGTSMATPHVSGAAACLFQYLEEEQPQISHDYYPLIAKAALIHTAEDRGTAGPDGTYGYGYLDMAHLNTFLDNGAITVGTLGSENVIYSRPLYYRFTLSSQQDFNLTFTWYRHVLYYSRSLYGVYGDGTPNNFDVYLYDYTSGTLLANSTDTLNNIEQIFYDDLPAGEYFIKIVQPESPQYLGSHPFAIASSHALTAFSPSSYPTFGILAIGPMLDVNYDYFLPSLFYPLFRTSGVGLSSDFLISLMQTYFYPFDSFERLGILVQVIDPDGIKEATLELAGSQVQEFNMTPIGGGYYYIYTDVLSTYIPAEYSINLFLSGVSLEGRISFTDNSIFEASISYDFVVAIRGFLISLPVFGIIFVALIFVIDYLRTRRAKKLGYIKPLK